jgi:O-antigen ligase
MEEVKRISEIDEAAAEDLNEGPSRLNKAVFFMLCAILVFSTVAYGAVDTWALGLLSVLAAVLAVLWIAEAWRKGELRFSASALQLPLLGLLLIGFIQLLPFGPAGVSVDLLTIQASNTISVDPYATRLFIIQLITYCIFFAAVLTFIDHRKRLRKMVLFIIIFVSVMAFFGILQRLASPDAIYGLRTTSQAIIFGSYVNQHHFAALMEMASGLTLALLFGKATKKDKQMLLIIAALLMGIAIIFTGSRGGLISFFSVLGFILAANAIPRKRRSKDSDESEDHKRGKSKWMLAGGAAALIITVFGLVLLLGGDKSLLRGVGLQSDGDFSTGRTHFWSVALQIFWHHPIFGAGLDAFGNAYPVYDSWNGVYRVERAHNEYLQILSDAGILGFSCVAAFIFLFFKKSIGVIRESHDGFRKHTAIGAVAGCLGIMVHSFFDFPLRTPANGFFFLTLAALATVAIYYPPPRRRRK